MYLVLMGSDATKSKAYSDADWASDTTDHKSTSGFICYLGDAPVHWGSRKQKFIASSSFESEYISLAEAAKETM